jgi:putative tricarboxylic transport membrane protein
MKRSASCLALAAAATILGLGVSLPAAAAWEPTRPVEFIVPAGTGGGADQMARTIQGIVTKHNLMNPHKIIITLSNLFTTPLATGIPFNWKDMTPVAMLALDEFVLWVNADKPYKTVKEYIEAVKAAPPGSMKMGGTGSKQEDQIITVAMEKAIGSKFTYIPYKGGGEVAVQLVGQHVDSTVNNPIEAVAQWRGGKVRPLCVFDSKPMAYDEVVADGKSWKDIPTCKSQGLDIEYVMLRGIFMSPKATKDQIDYYVELFKKIRATPEWQDLMKSGAFNTTFMTGGDYAGWVGTEEKRHETLMKEAGFLASN